MCGWQLSGQLTREKPNWGVAIFKSLQMIPVVKDRERLASLQFKVGNVTNGIIDRYSPRDCSGSLLGNIKFYSELAELFKEVRFITSEFFFALRSYI